MSTNPKRRWFRFRVLTLLGLLTLVAACSWLYWYGWPLYEMHQEQMAFEAKIREQFRPGHTEYVARDLGGLEGKLVGFTSDANGNSVGFVRLEWPNASYVIYGPLKKGGATLQEFVGFDGVEVFRLAPVPPSYAPQTEQGKKALPRSPKGNVYETPQSQAYRNDFIAMIAGDRRDDLGFEYELIHSVPPPAKPTGSD